MGMNGMLRRVPAADWTKAQKDPEYLLQLTSVGFGMSVLGSSEEFWAMLPWYYRWPLKLLFGKQIKAAQAQQESLQKEASPEGGPVLEEGAVLNLHKSWHALHWLMCQSPSEGPEPLRSAIVGGEEFGQDLGYGPARLVEPSKVREVADALALLSASQLMKRYDGKKMEELAIYPGGFDDDEDWRSELRRDFARLKKFYTAAARQGDGVASWIS
jgi:hypothetical protein